MPRKSARLKQLEFACQEAGLDFAGTLIATRRLLEGYSNLRWMAEAEESLSADTITATIQEATSGLAVFDWLSATPSPSQSLPITHAEGLAFFLGLMRQALAQIAAYPQNGTLYHSILQGAYFAPAKTLDAAIAASLHLERSTYYQRKREAVALYGTLIYLHYLPEIRRLTT